MFNARWGGYLSIVLLVGLVGGLSLGALAAARRTQSSFATYLASTNPSDLSLGTGLFNPSGGQSVGYNAALVEAVAHLPRVRRVESYIALNAAPVTAAGAPINSNVTVNYLGSVDGEYFDQDRVTVVAGRMADPARPDEVVVSTSAAQLLGWHVGEMVHLGIYTLAQVANPGSVPPPPAHRVDVHVVGVGRFNDSVVLDDVDASNSANVLLTPALTDPLLQCCPNFAFSYLRLDGRSRSVPTVESEIQSVFPLSLPFDPHALSAVTAKATRAVKPLSIALAVFGGIAALAVFLIVAQVISRQLWFGADDLVTLRALGAGPATTTADGLIGVIGAVVIGAVVAVTVAVGLSPLAPIGPVRPVYPSRGVAFDWTVLAGGLTVLVLGLSVLAMGLALRISPHRVAERRQRAAERPSGLAHAASAAGLPPAAVTGIRFAVEPGSGRNVVPVRAAIAGAVLALVVMVATVTFGASLNALVARPPLYGWNWNVELSGGGGVGDIPEQQATTLLNADRDVLAWSGAYFANLQFDGHTVPVLGETPRAAVSPPVLTGHGLEASGQVVLGAATLDALHKHVGDTVAAGYGHGPTTPLVIVGTATLPTTGISGVDITHLSMGTGAWLDYQLIPPSVRNSFGNAPTGPNAMFVRFRRGVDPNAAVASLNRIAGPLNLPTNYGVTVVSVQRPAEIMNYRTMGSTPFALGAGLACGALFALGLTLVASVYRRRRDLALLKVLGFSRRQLSATLAWQATVAVGIGTAVGVPLGIVSGRVLWDLFARGINAVPAPTVPVLPEVLIAAGAIILSNVVAAVPGRIAARTPTALVLRGE